MQITVVTSNDGKFKEIQDTLKKFNIEAVQSSFDAVEVGNTLESRCLSKAKHAFLNLQKPLIVDDTGLFFNAYENFPGPFPKKVYTEIGFEGIFKKLKWKKREATFKTLLCFTDGKRTELFKGKIKGRISETIFNGGIKSLPYDKIFIPEGYDKPFCTLSFQEKNSISHRTKAVKKFALWYSNL